MRTLRCVLVCCAMVWCDYVDYTFHVSCLSPGLSSFRTLHRLPDLLTDSLLLE